jgi:hypothetical protein
MCTMLDKLKISKTILIIMASIITGVAAIGASVYFYTRYQKALQQIQNPQAAGQQELADIVGRIAKVMDLPTGEQPTLATVTDVTKLKDQPFFAKAKNGDKVLIYNTARKAILFDPVSNKILEVAPLTVASGSAQQTAVAITPGAEQTVSNIVLYNGTDVVGLTTTIEQDLKKKGDFINVVLRDNAKKRDYEKTTVIDLTGGTKKAQAQKIALDLKATFASLPEGESVPALSSGETAEILIIAGKDYAPITPSVTTPTTAQTTPAQ